MVIRETLIRSDPFEARTAAALALEKMAPLIPQSLVAPIFGFLISREALGDRKPEVRKAMLNAAIAIVDLHGGEAVTSLMKMYEDYLGKSGPSSETADYIKEAVVIVSTSRLRKSILFTPAAVRSAGPPSRFCGPAHPAGGRSPRRCAEYAFGAGPVCSCGLSPSSSPGHVR